MAPLWFSLSVSVWIFQSETVQSERFSLRIFPSWNFQSQIFQTEHFSLRIFQSWNFQSQIFQSELFSPKIFQSRIFQSQICQSETFQSWWLKFYHQLLVGCFSLRKFQSQTFQSVMFQSEMFQSQIFNQNWGKFIFVNLKNEVSCLFNLKIEVMLSFITSKMRLGCHC